MTKPSAPNAADFGGGSNCAFHRWAYQNFLYLTSPDATSEDGELVFETLANPSDLFKPDGPSPTAYPGRSDGNSVQMLARLAKSTTTVDIDSVFQAGPGNKALIDQGANIVYYSNHLDQTYWDFITQNEFYQLDKLQGADPTLDFPVSSLELKSSWRMAELDGNVFIPDADKRFHVIETEVPSVTPDPDTGVLISDPNNLLKAKMALVGMHVTGVVEDHPEFIWATFEHVDNAPNCADAPAQNTHGGWNFNDGKATSEASNQFNVGNPLAVVNVCLLNPMGGGEESNQTAITTLNSSVQGIIADSGGSIWSNYHLVGGVWTTGSGPNGSEANGTGVPVNNGDFTPADKDAGATQLGSLLLANTSMETFTQNDNCLSCHNGGAHEFTVTNNAVSKSTEIGAKNINLSHFVVNYQAQQQVTN